MMYAGKTLEMAMEIFISPSVIIKETYTIRFSTAEAAYLSWPMSRVELLMYDISHTVVLVT